jgi:type VI secretion system secreted protein Hcp
MKNNYFFYAILLLVCTTTVSLAQGIFLHHPTVTKNMGNSQIHRDEVELTSYQWGVARGISSAAGGREREASPPSVSEITITKQFDRFSTILAQLATYGRTSGEAYEIRFYAADRDNREVLTLRITLSGVLFSSYSQSSGGCQGGCPDISESTTMNFTKIEIENIVERTPLPKYIWDLVTQRPQ